LSVLRSLNLIAEVYVKPAVIDEIRRVSVFMEGMQVDEAFVGARNMMDIIERLEEVYEEGVEAGLDMSATRQAIEYMKEDYKKFTDPYRGADDDWRQEL